MKLLRVICSCIGTGMPAGFEEDVALQQRMSAIGDIIQEQGYPHFICFQVQLFET